MPSRKYIRFPRGIFLEARNWRRGTLKAPFSRIPLRSRLLSTMRPSNQSFQRQLAPALLSVSTPYILYYRRYYSSNPNSQDGGTKPKIATATSARDSSQVLFFAAQEADRLSGLATKTETPLTEENVKQALDAANGLLIVSRPSNTLADAILQKAAAPQIASLHRAFLAITSWCLDVVPYEKAILDNDILDRALKVARRAHELSLPFHLPLYQRLVDTVAAHAMDSVADTILEISSWVTATLDAPITASFFGQTLLTLARRQRFADVADLLRGVQERHNLYALDMEIATEILLILRESFREALQDPTRNLPEADAIEIVSLLEPSVHHVLQQGELPDSLRDKMKDFPGKFNVDEVESMLERMLEEEADDGDDDDEDVSDDSDEDFTEAKGQVDPLDLAIDSILTRRITNEKAKKLFSDLIKYSRSDKDLPTRPSIKVLESYTDGDNVYSAAQAESDGTESDWTDYEDMMYLRDKDDFRFPDVVSQMMQLNGGRRLVFTRVYEDMIWMRDYEEDLALFDSVFGNSRIESDDDDDDSDDDEF